MKIKQFLFRNYPEIIVLALGSIFGFFLMFSTFSSMDGNLIISSKAWSDFASHIPLIRSFSLGSNFPVEYPLFSGEPIKYHFIFYYLVGLLEKIGLNIGLALNIPSFIGFMFLLFMIYYFSKEVFKSKAVGILSTIFFLFNSSLSYVYFFKKYPLSKETINQLITNADFLSFAPYGDGIVSAFWNLNIYTNQRHLAISFALSLFIIYQVIKPVLNREQSKTKIYIILGSILGLSFFLHTAVFLMTGITLLALLIYFSKIRKDIFILLATAGLISIPQYLYLSGSPGFSPHLQLGYLISGNLTLQNFSEFWIYNLGLSLILIPLGFIFANRVQKKILLAFFVLFLVGNFIQFSIEIASNHKFFNYFLIIGNMFSAFTLVSLIKQKNYLITFIPILFFFMILGGLIDIFPILNDRKFELTDYTINKDTNWILNNTNPDSIFLNSTYLYNPASLAGRKIFMGWPYFAWSAGYDTNKRGEIMKQILGANDKLTACKLLIKNNIDYVEIKIQTPPDPNIPPISELYKIEFVKSYDNPENNYSIYSVNKNCLL